MTHLHSSNQSLQLAEFELRQLAMGDAAEPTDGKRQAALIEAIATAHRTWHPRDWEVFGIAAMRILIDFQSASHAAHRALDAS